MRLAAQVFVEHLRDDRASLVTHGSAVAGGYVPGGSDVDFVLIPRPDVMSPDGHLCPSRR